MIRRALCLAPLLLAACETGDRQLIRDLPTTASFHVSGLQKEAHVVRTEADVPHIYAATRHDAAYVLGFTTARDRFFMMDLARRLGTGRVSELLGDAGLATDLESRLTGMTYLADQIAAKLSPLLADHIDAYVAGINEYLARCQAGELPPPSEFEIAYPFLGASGPTDLMKPFERRDIAAIVAVTIYNSSFEPGDIRRAAIAAKLPGYFAGVSDEALRKEGLLRDIYSPVAPLYPVASAPGLGTSRGSSDSLATHSTPVREARLARGPEVPTALLDRLNRSLERMQKRMNRDRVSGYGSNAWAVARYATANGNAVVAGDGHLSLSVPSILYQFGLDTTVFGDGELHQLGLSIPGFPLMAIGTNGHVAWSQTQLGEDITDWYREVVMLDHYGEPVATKWGEGWMPIVRLEESFAVAGILGGKARTETWARYQTFDGRWLGDWEGRVALPSDVLPAGEHLQYGLSGYVVPGDEDHDGIVTAISFNYAGHFAGELLSATDALGHADDVEAFREGTRGLVAYSQNFAASDWHGNILYSSYQAVPCRKHLPRDPDGRFALGADPTLLLDGTRHGGWSIPVRDGLVDESDPQACVVPFEQIPQSINPNAGYVLTANNDPGGLSFDGSIFNDAVYLGGPWNEGLRADSIGRALRKQIADNRASVEGMAEVQANVDSRLGELFTPALLAAIGKGRTAGALTDPASLRLSAIYAVDAGAFDEIEERLSGWREHGYQARSGVPTFYASPGEREIADSVATMIFNAWVRKLKARLLGDEGIDEVLGLLGGEVQVRVMAQLLDGRGDEGQALLGSWHPQRRESVFFDDLRTPAVIETSDEILLLALGDALAFLRAAPDKTPGDGGFGTRDMSQWRWGLRHQVRFESLIADYVSDPALSIITSQLEINTDVLPLASPGETIAGDDPRAGLHWFPRDGDQYTVDAANPGIDDSASFAYDHGPVMRMVFELSPSGVRGLNVIPGGQSGRTSSPHYADQARMWLGNRAYPARFAPSAVVGGATGHELFSPF